ncbi:MAG: Gfo/Idh/MocA family oxidoreductase [Planctomycetota bacterium]|nr:Gfo/Idh/MocA family oxidoreductase [Planctomycetota bacterium]
MSKDSKTDGLRLGVVGCGGVARIAMAPVIRYLENAQLCAVMDPDKARAEFISNTYGPCEVYTDYDRMLEQADIDAVMVCSPVYTHEDNVVKAALAHKHVFCEKPLARTVGECDRMIRACRENDVKLMVGVMKRFNPCFQEAARMIRQGILGNVFHVDVLWESYSMGAPKNWHHSLEALGGGFQDHASHTVDLAAWWLGDVRSVDGKFHIIQEHAEVEDAGIAFLRHAGDAISVHQLIINVSHRRDLESYRIHGTNGVLEMWFEGGSWSSNQPFHMRFFEKGRIETQINLFDIDPSIVDPEGRIRGYNAYYRELEHFCRCVLEDTQPAQDGAEGRKVVEVINATYLSSAQERSITLPLSEEVDLERIFIDAKRAVR